ncbi:MAG: class I SAM-dependent methyltransferase [Gammaproteobacteria bacterium]|nr:class I SAM-dependent methyltransferase [Gammaproteobacteria bacterium]MDH4254361.1 class I SAM-dependent methyltransferase [Gammaproteobacteria bacterium]MDH5309378.1 class I SAM-dependent methyltransferase [Gammaproteobacteria bacterium]
MTKRSSKETALAAGDAWSRYWASRTLHSCPCAFSGNYDDEIREFWLGFFGDLPDGARVLDIGTGNGAVAFLACDAARQSDRTFHVEGIDAAEIHPAEAARQHGIDASQVVFSSRTACEQTGYPDARFDAVSSQYAVEYSRVADTLAEIARILKPGGRAGFILHHKDSEALATTRAEIRAFDFLRDEAALVVPSRRLLKRLGYARNPQDLAKRLQEPESKRLRAEIEALIGKVGQFAGENPQAAFAQAIALQVARILNGVGTNGPAAAMESLRILEDEMAAHRARLEAIRKAAQDATDLDRFCETARAVGLLPSAPAELRRAGRELLGWTLSASRAT